MTFGKPGSITTTRWKVSFTSVKANRTWISGGVKWTKQLGFNQITGFPLAQASREEILRYRFPTEHLPELLRLMLPVMEFRQDYFIGCDVSPCAFEMYWRLRGMENAMLDIVTDPDLADEMFRRCADFALELSQGRLCSIRLGLALDGRRCRFSACDDDEPSDLALADQTPSCSGCCGGEAAGSVGRLPLLWRAEACHS